jgi:hypothetical protein
MTKQELRSYIFNGLPKLDSTNKFHQRFLDACIERVIAELYWEMFAIEPHSIQRYTVRYGVTAPVAVTYSNTLGIYYSTIPAGIISLPDKASGVRRISTITQGGMAFFPIDSREIDLLNSGSYADTVTSKIGYVVGQTQVDYYGMTAAIAAVGVRMEILQRFSSYADTDTVLIPEFRDNQGIDFMDRVRKVLMVLPPVEQIDDNSDSEQTNKKQ